MLAADFGDAASAIGGAYVSASHEAVGPKLGVLRDANSTSVANVMANGDASDEEGVIFSALRAGQSAAMTVHVSNAPAGALLYAAIDFNRDNDWVDADERIAFNAAVVEGDNVLNFTVPATVAGGYYYARVRLSTASILGPSGVAPDGEVEDHLIPIAHANSGSIGGEQPLSFNDVTRIAPTDLDGDGDLDLLTSRLGWIENINGRFGEEKLLRSPTSASISAVAVALAPADVDGDGDMDFFATLYNNRELTWYENNGSQAFTRRSIQSGGAGEAIVATDLDGDGDLDVMCGSSGAMRWFANNGSQTFTRIDIPGAPGGVESLVVDDMDDDGDLDVIAATYDGQTVRWLENNGSQQFTVRDVATVNPYLRSVATADLDGDGDLDVAAAYAWTQGGIVWFENDGNEAFTIHRLDAAAWDASSVAIADLDDDGDLDVAGTGTNRTAWYENNGNQTFTPRIIAAAAGSHLDLTTADLNGDGRLDLLAAGQGVTPIAWYPQLADYDYGDAPSPYRVYSQEYGARHNAVGPRLGATRDAEANGAHSPAGAEAEDDGVVFGTLSLSESTDTVTVNVQNAPAGAKLDAWIDFNADGTWGSEGEQIARSFAVVEGDNTLTFAIPQWAVAGATYARFRLSTAGDLNPQGVALDGEVEDYPVTLANRDAATGFFEEPKLVGSASSPFGGAFMLTDDVDGDGDVDVVSKAGYSFLWAENVGPDGFVTHTVAAPGLSGEDMTTGDLDNDGDVDFVGFGYVQQKNVLLWAENDGEQNFTVRTSSLANLTGNFVALTMADVDGDGDSDILAASLGAGVYAFVNNGRQEFTPQFIGHLGYYATSVAAADMDRDGDLDVVVGGVGVLSGGVLPYDVAWFQNNGGLTFSSLRGIQRRAISSFNTSGATESVAVGDIDGDGDFDVVSAGVDSSSLTANATLWWHEQLADQTFVSHAIDYDRNFRWATLADFDADGDLDVVATGYTSSVDLYENINGQSFFKRQISVAGNAGMSSSAADMDNDGDLDLVALAVPDDPYVSWFENINLVDPDYGDAPAPYPSTRANDGAVHSGGGPRLGATRTSEADGTQSPNADGDSGDDGVAFSPIQVGQSLATVTVNVQNAPAGAKLDAWIDFNGDGSWGGAGEQIFASYPVVEGDTILVFNVPAHIPAGSTVARFRLSTAGGLRPGGVSLDGEVEDYRLVVDAPDRATGEYQTAAHITTSATSIRIADIDGDGDADLLTVRESSPQLAWHENLGDGSYLTHTRGLLGARDARPIDLDGDGDVDFVVVNTNGNGNGFGWYENNGQQNFTYRSTSPTANNLIGPFELADVDGDGDLDVFSARPTTGQALVVLINDGQQKFTAQPALSTPAYAVSGIRASDIDRDGDVDFAIAFESNASSGAAGWYENNAGAWTFHDLTTVAGQPSRAARDVVPIDFDFDGDIDLVATTVPNPTTLELFRNDGNQVFARESLATGVAGVWTINSFAGERLQVADLDGDGDYDAVAGTNNSVRLYRNEGTAGFTQTNIFQGSSGSSMPIALGDLDGDGRLEIVASIGLSSLVRLDDRPFGDYDRNGTVDQADRDLYEATLGQTALPPGSGADGDRSGVVDAADLAIWEANQGAAPTPQVHAADLNLDERIDGADFLLWQIARSGGGLPYPGAGYADFDHSGTIDSGDLDVWKRHYGQGVAPPASVSVVAVSSAMTSSNAMAVASPELDSSATQSSPASSFAVPANVVLARPAEKQVSKQSDALHLKRNSTAPRDAAFAALASPVSIARRLRPTQVQELQSGRASDARSAQLDAALVDELLSRTLDR